LEDKNAIIDTAIKFIKQKALDIIKGDLKRLGNLLTDIYPTMQLV
jgi:adenylosuccinate lyase